MSQTRKIEIFSAGCATCDETVKMVEAVACPSCEIEVLDMHQDGVAAKSKKYGIKSVPAVVVDGTLLDCCSGRGVDEETLRASGVGTPLS